ncbi:nicolin-1-like [Anneissia japonica]|uniref:nicolin-1-like n=1 Tax=Anneissia japonica TaxID=1529436 RepID=UPI0014259A1D|nr:nicolin-1-like [Anneissia japonica]
MAASSSIKCIIKKPVEVKISDTKSSLCSGLSIVDVTFPNHSEKGICQLGTISFKNVYTAFVTIKIKSSELNGKWRTCLHRYQLMKSAHCESGSQDHFTISSSQMLFVPQSITAIRLVLQQPSFLWNHFGIEQISIETPSQAESGQKKSISKWLEQHLTSNSAARKKIENVEVDSISEGLHRLWALTETVKARQTSSTLGRYDVDDSYDINLLSYT